MNSSASNVRLSCDRYFDNIGTIFKSFYNDEQLADVTLCCKDGTIKAHKLILAACSPYFHRIFSENQQSILSNYRQPLVIMHGVNFQTLQHLIELIYHGSCDVSSESIDAIEKLIKELEINDHNFNVTTANNGGRRDTRFKGLKRVAVDYKESDEDGPSSLSALSANKRTYDGGDNSDNSSETHDQKIDIIDDFIPYDGSLLQHHHSVVLTNASFNNDKDETSPPLAMTTAATIKKTPLPPSSTTTKLSAWAKKQRKFQCELCPSSFKRASHLSRHQLVHTGERPYACNQCDKAFSRHDKLKHHIRKAHDDLMMFNDLSSNTITLEHFQEKMRMDEEVVVEAAAVLGVTSTEEEECETVVAEEASASTSLTASDTDISATTANNPKRGRGRPRKYPIVTNPLPKRNRGRPRLNPVHHSSATASSNSAITASTAANGENYDITNLPYGDLEFLTMPLRSSQPQSQRQHLLRSSSPHRNGVIIDAANTSITTANSTTTSTSTITNTTTSIDDNSERCAVDAMMIEPLVEIKTELNDDIGAVSAIAAPLVVRDNDGQTMKKFMATMNENEANLLCCSFDNKIAKIGECTISVAKH